MSADRREVKVVRDLPAAPEVVFDEWLDPHALMDWMCPRPARAVAVTVDAAVGGSFRIDVVEDGETFWLAGRYRTLDRPHRLVFTWTCSTWQPPQDTLVTVTLQPLDHGRTRMTIHHVGLDPTRGDGHERGWERIARQLHTRLSAGPPRTATPGTATPGTAAPETSVSEPG